MLLHVTSFSPTLVTVYPGSLRSRHGVATMKHSKVARRGVTRDWQGSRGSGYRGNAHARATVASWQAGSGTKTRLASFSNIIFVFTINDFHSPSFPLTA